MAYRILVVRQAEKDLNKLDAVVKKRIKASLTKFSQNPLFYSKKLTSSRIGDYRFRVGKYRIIFDLDNVKSPFYEDNILRLFKE